MSGISLWHSTDIGMMSHVMMLKWYHINVRNFITTFHWHWYDVACHDVEVISYQCLEFHYDIPLTLVWCPMSWCWSDTISMSGISLQHSTDIGMMSHVMMLKWYHINVRNFITTFHWHWYDVPCHDVEVIPYQCQEFHYDIPVTLVWCRMSWCWSDIISMSGISLWHSTDIGMMSHVMMLKGLNIGGISCWHSTDIDMMSLVMMLKGFNINISKISCQHSSDIILHMLKWHHVSVSGTSFYHSTEKSMSLQFHETM